jgi:hypothetical protein
MESAEHAWIGDQIHLTFPQGAEPSTEVRLGTGGSTTLTYGQCIALGGDFYGVVGKPISSSDDVEEAFLAAWDSLVGAGQETVSILSVMDEEIAAVTAARKEGLEPSSAYQKLGDTLSARWNQITGGGLPGNAWLPFGRYLNLAAENFDHFTHFAITAYTAGHAVATAAAKEAGATKDVLGLQRAYAMNAFADHFMTDLFSAGHLRVPRKELYDLVLTPLPGFSGSLGSYLTRYMHNEDSFEGLNVTNKNGDHWKAYGDKRLLDSDSAANAAMVTKAVQASADDVWAAFETGDLRTSALAIVPDLARLLDVRDGIKDPSTAQTYSPLFRMQDGKLCRRTDVTNLRDFTWTSDWWGWTTFIALSGDHHYRHAMCSILATGEDVGWLSSLRNSPRVVKDEAEAHGVTWYFDDDKLYLRKDTSGGDRYLGLGSRNYASWGDRSAGGWWNPVVFGKDGTIALADHPERKLFLDNDDWLSWTHGPDSDFPTILSVDLPLWTPEPDNTENPLT